MDTVNAYGRLVARLRTALIARDGWELRAVWLTANRWQRLTGSAFLRERLELVKVAAAEAIA